MADRLSTRQRPDYNSTLNRLADLLRQAPLTARAIAKALKISKPTAYEQIDALRTRGFCVYSLPIRESPTGPGSTAYGVR